MKFLLIYLLIINAIGFTIMHADKEKAKRGAWRISEAMLLWVAALGGSIGSLCGIYWFRHKTKHPKFTVGVPMILAAQIILAVTIYSLL